MPRKAKTPPLTVAQAIHVQGVTALLQQASRVYDTSHLTDPSAKLTQEFITYVANQRPMAEFEALARDFALHQLAEVKS